jgi:exopolyphosphatase / guanosine-5'-triphosphate,3'-diphosphate pyrophosphatase
VARAAGLTRHHRTLLSAAALLHDLGYHIAHEGHHKHALYLVRNSELTGFSEGERDVIANVARYHRGSVPKEKHQEFWRLKRSDRDTVRTLAAILRVADALDRNHDGRVRVLGCAREDRKFQLTLECAGDCEREVAAAESKRELFEEVFGCELAIGVNGLGSDTGGERGDR